MQWPSRIRLDYGVENTAVCDRMVAVDGSGRGSLLRVLPRETKGLKGFGGMFLDVFAMCLVRHVIHII